MRALNTKISRALFVRQRLLRFFCLLACLCCLPLAAKDSSSINLEPSAIGHDSWVAPRLGRIESVEPTRSFWVKSTFGSSEGARHYIISKQHSRNIARCLIQNLVLSRGDAKKASSVVVAKQGPSILLPGEVLEPGASLYLEEDRVSSSGLAQ